MNVLLVEPEFPKPSKSKNHNDFMPIGLLKLASYHRNIGDAIYLVQGDVEKDKIFFEHSNGILSKNREPNKILITSYFTYWSIYVKRSVSHYRKMFPKAFIIVGGIYASLLPKHCKRYTECDEVFVGVHPEAEKCKPALGFLEKYHGTKDYQIIHTSRGCIRRCEFCGVYEIEPEFTYKSSVKDEIIKRKIVFYDNNLLANPAIENILTELGYLKEKGKILWCESQSGLDGRIIEKNLELAYLLKKAGFKNVRISWDGPLSDAPHIEKQIYALKSAGFKDNEEIFIFMIYNWEIPYEEMEQKRLKCWEWKVQISDCRYRPLTQKYDRYSGQKFRQGQTWRDYHIHSKAGWTDTKVRTFRQHIRNQNICVRYRLKFYSNSIERTFLNKYVSKIVTKIARSYEKDKIEPILNSLKIPYWFPENFNGNGHYVSKEDVYEHYENLTQKPAIVKNKESSTFRTWRNKVQRELLIELKLI